MMPSVSISASRSRRAVRVAGSDVGSGAEGGEGGPSPSVLLLKPLPHSLLLADRRASMKLGAGKAVESGGDGGGE